MLLLKTFMFAALISCLTQSFFMPLSKSNRCILNVMPKVSNSLKSIPKVLDFDNSTRTDLILKVIQNDIIENNRIFLNEALDNKFMLLNNNIKELRDIGDKNINELRGDIKELRDIGEKNIKELRDNGEKNIKELRDNGEKNNKELRDKISPLTTIYAAATLVAGAMLQFLFSRFLGK